MRLSANLLSLVLLFPIFPVSAAGDTKPNVLFLLADDLGWADTTLYGHTKLYETPNVERLARRGMTFTRAYAASPLCSPTRSSILTGLHPARTGLTTPNCHLPEVVLKATPGGSGPKGNKSVGPRPVTRLLTDYVTLAEVLKEAGYATGHFGKWHLGPEPYSPLEQGFEVDVPHFAGPGPAGSYVAPWKFRDFDADPGEPDQHIEDRMAKEASAFMEKNRDRPFFLNYWMFSVHAPFDAKAKLVEKYRGRVDPADPQRCPTYAAMVESMDDAVGTLLDTLDRLGLAERTIIVFFSDNGGNMYSHVDGTVPTSNLPLRGGKATVFEGGIRVPCVVAWPRHVEPGSRSDAMVQSCDFFPTLMDLAGLPLPNGVRFDGNSFRAALEGRAYERGPLFTYFPHDPPVPDWLPPSLAVHEGDWKLIRIFFGGENGAHRYKLFHLSDDPGEKNDLAASEPERVKAMDRLMEDFLARTHAVVPVPNPAFDPSSYDPSREGVPAAKHAAASKPETKRNPGEAKDDALLGWKPRGCTAAVKDGILTVTPSGAAPFLGFPAGSLAGPAEVTLRIRAAGGGAGKVEWLPAPDAADKAQSVPFDVGPGDWQEVKVTLPAKGPLGIVRVYLPAKGPKVEVDRIGIRSRGGGKEADV